MFEKCLPLHIHEKREISLLHLPVGGGVNLLKAAVPALHCNHHLA